MELAKTIHDCRRERLAAQQHLVSRFAPHMFQLCRRYLPTDADAEEAMMNGFTRFFTTLKQFTYSSDAGLAAWIKNLMLNECRNSSRQSKVPQPSVEVPEYISIPDDISTKLGLDDIRGLLTKLPPDYSKVFQLYAIEGYSHKEIGVSLGIPESSVRCRYARARLLLQDLLTLNSVL